jgi:Domain of unknown function (DUF4328)
MRWRVVDETVVCPRCQAQLMLPTLPAGQTVQCPRCRHVFEPYRQRVRATVPPPPVVVKDDPYELPRDLERPLPLRGEKLGKLATWLIGGCCFLAAVQFYLHVEAGRVIHKLLDGAGLAAFDLEERLFELEERTRTFGGLLIFAAFVAGVVYLMWVYHASKNLVVLNVKGIRNSPGGTVWAHLMPIANLVLPYLALQEIWRASDPDSLNGPRSWQTTPASTLIRACWACGCFAWLLAALGAKWYSLGDHVFAPFRDLGDQQIGVWLYALAYLTAIITGVLCILLIRGITQRQRDRHAEVFAEQNLNSRRRGD